MIPHICSWSGGKDSTATVILCKLYNIPLHTILFSEVMYDRKRNISGENPLHMDFIYNKAIPKFKQWGYEVKILRSNSDYISHFNRIITNPRKHLNHKGKAYGFPISGTCSINRDCKMKPIDNYIKSLNNNCVQYIGYCANESTRYSSIAGNPNKRSLLYEYGLTNEDALNLCREFDLLSPVYEQVFGKSQKRQGCWFCPNAKIEEHRFIRDNFPDVWYEFIELEKRKDLAFNKWNIYKKETLADRNIMFLEEDKLKQNRREN